MLIASKNYIGEELKHTRKDSFVEFARGDVNFRVGKNGYSADVIVDTTKDGRAILYDIVLDVVGYTVTFNIRDKGKSKYQYLIEIKENGYAVSHTTLQGLRQSYRASTNTTVAQNASDVNPQSMQNSGGNAQSAYIAADQFVDRMALCLRQKKIFPFI